ncbi:MAG: hypothetical protein GVY36_19770 [Verrucomicrobia bacterium]|jgi:hypothetical protein|nr:hypothetical protein [Verrucomicrobiota bacterium]
MARRSRNFIALGGAQSVWSDYEAAKELCPDHDVGACNDAGKDFPGQLSIWATLHPELFRKWQRHRKGNQDYVSITRRWHPETRIDHVFDGSLGGSSGLYLVKCALRLGYERIICCGIPLNDDPHYFDNEAWDGVSRYRRHWLELQPHETERIRSMSGWTREILGYPTQEWLSVAAE